MKYPANHTQDDSRAVGGRLSIEADVLCFTPNAIDIRLGGRALKIGKDEISDIAAEPRAVALNELFTGGLRDRLKIVRKNGGAELFVVDRLPSVIAELQKWLDE